jgi:hypothetical protein
MNGWSKRFEEQANFRNQAFYAFTERLVTLSTGALALSITFRKSFSQPVPVHLELLRFSWIAFVVVILTSTLVQFGRITIHQRLARAAGQAATADNDTYVIAAGPGWWHGPAKWIMLLSFPAGIVTLAAFALYNLE